MPLSPEHLFDALRSGGDRPALREGAVTLSGAQVLAAVEARAAQLRAGAVSRLAIALDNGIAWVLWDLAALRAGVACVPLPGFFSPAQQSHVVDDAGIDAVAAPQNAPVTDLLVGAGFAPDGLGLYRRDRPRPSVLPAGTAKITYTSGTTGQPKGVCLDAATQLAVADSLRQAAAPCAVEHHLCVLPLATLLENIAGVYAPLLAGACVELAPTAAIGYGTGGRFDATRLLALLQRSQPHSLILVPQLLFALVGAAAQGATLPASLRFVAVGGGRVSPALLERAAALGLPVFEGYGLSECGSVVCLNPPGQNRIGTVGRPLPHAEVRISDDGAVLVRGPRMLGYLGEAAVAPSDWLDTGDLGHFDNGHLVLHGRRKHQFITAYGRNVNPEWVEAELTQQATIAQAWLHGEALPANVAVLVPRHPELPDAALDAAVAAVNRHLPDYARVHRWLRADAPFTAANGLATANGRLRRAALLDHYRPHIDRVAATEPLCGDA